ncbi:MAG: HD domain-containing phosphohydrolase, partial [Lachnospiraceae bacterium]|nr:HD domain-containing phosphohydrolase [Lachnospiraceae bacterium]
IPPEILNKPAKLTPEEFEVIKQHSRLSYDLVKKNPEISLSVAMAMLQHHEKTDGSGYPVGAMANLIHPYAKIMAVADIYDALVSTRPYKKAYTPGEAVDILLGMSSCLDMRALQTFMKVMVLYPVDSLVKLSNGETARVVKQNANLLLRPVVVGVKSGKVYDLSKIECANILIRS